MGERLACQRDTALNNRYSVEPSRTPNYCDIIRDIEMDACQNSLDCYGMFISYVAHDGLVAYSAEYLPRVLQVEMGRWVTAEGRSVYISRRRVLERL